MNGEPEEDVTILVLSEIFNIGLVGECYITMEPVSDYYDKHNLCVHD